MRFENHNGEDIFLYPGIALMPRADGAFALVDIRDIEIDGSAKGFHEEEGVPPDAEVIGHTWAKANKDGSPDRRFANNYQIPICAYGSSRSGPPAASGRSTCLECARRGGLCHGVPGLPQAIRETG